ncbi:Uncharacterised protein [Serratia quinivorans]|nr:Uncharacterised protein [Serratia quinivorans]
MTSEIKSASVSPSGCRASAQSSIAPALSLESSCVEAATSGAAAVDSSSEEENERPDRPERSVANRFSISGVSRVLYVVVSIRKTSLTDQPCAVSQVVV